MIAFLRLSFLAFFSSIWVFALPINAANSHQRVHPGGSIPRESVAFLPAIVLDLKREKEIDRPSSKNHQLSDCTSDNYFCLKGTIANVSWPKDCRFLQIGQTWNVGQANGKVERFVHIQRHLVSQRRYLIVNPNSDGSMFVVGPAGLTHIIYSPLPDIRPPTDKGLDEIVAAIETGKQSAAGFMITEKVSFAEIGRCG